MLSCSWNNYTSRPKILLLIKTELLSQLWEPESTDMNTSVNLFCNVQFLNYRYSQLAPPEIRTVHIHCWPNIQKSVYSRPTTLIIHPSIVPWAVAVLYRG